MRGVGGVWKGVGIVAEEVSKVECVGDGLDDINGPGLGNMSSRGFLKKKVVRFFFLCGRGELYVRSSWLGLLRRIGR